MTQQIEFVTDWKEKALSLLVEQFKDKQKLNDFLSCFLEEAQLLEDTFEQLYTLRWLDVAYGAQLDGLGQILALERQGLNDEDYRIALRFQALLNASKGESEILIEALKIFTRSDDVTFFEIYPAACYGYYSNYNYPITPYLNAKMQGLCAGGVKWYGSIIGNERPFIFDKLYTIPNDSRLFGGFAIADASNNVIDDGTCGLFCFFV
jgi:hypothetical protein